MVAGLGRLKKLQQIAQDPAESQIVQALVTIVVRLESRQLEAVQELHDALDMDGVQVQATEEDRREHLLDLVDAVASGSLRSWWFEEVVADHVENPEDSKAYAGLDADEWEQQKERWAETYRDRGGEEVEEYTDEELAQMHVESTFGVPIDEFETEVVEWSRQEAIRNVLAGNFEAVETGINAAAVKARKEDA